MSLRIINKLISIFSFSMNVEIGNIIVKNIEIEDNDSYYEITLKLGDELYNIRHFEPIESLKNVYYVDGPYNEYYIFDKLTNKFKKIQKKFL